MAGIGIGIKPKLFTIKIRIFESEEKWNRFESRYLNVRDNYNISLKHLDMCSSLGSLFASLKICINHHNKW